MLAGQLGNTRALPENAYRLSETDSHTRLEDLIIQCRSSEELAARRDMITLIRRSYKMDLFTATLAPIPFACLTGASLLRRSALTVLIWRRTIWFRIKGDAKEIGKLPSRAVLAHRKIYQENPQIGAVLFSSSSPCNGVCRHGHGI